MPVNLCRAWDLPRTQASQMCRKNAERRGRWLAREHGTWEGLALAQRTCAKKLMLDPKSARTRLGTRQAWDHQRKNSESPSGAEPDQRSNAVTR